MFSRRHLLNTLFLASASALGLSACDQSSEDKTAQNKPELLLYCGITMVPPLKKMAEAFEANTGIKVIITQGGSQDLYEALKFSQKGDLYLPGSTAYYDKNKADGFFTQRAFLGFNRMALVVAKGNPKNLTADLAQLTDTKLSVILCDPKSGSVGQATQKLLKKVGLEEAAYKNATYIATDSRRINEAFKHQEADISINWQATTTWEANQPYVQAIELPDDLAQPRRLEISGLSFSKHPAEAQQFMDFAASAAGLKIMKDYGFFNEAEWQAAHQK
ncbi:molybdate ABC transporter substrate-binding protein [Thiosulfativibrio zosterae]|nr:molybdate ABC transporter substrate-binding protein [Thiosulfativibrio zosterae]